MERKIYVTSGREYVDMTINLMEKANISQKIPKGASVALKPNLVVASPASGGATTHREILEGCIIYLQKAGITNISIIEGSWVGDRTERAFKVSKYDTLSKQYGVPLFDLKKDTTVNVKTAIGDIAICKKALDTDYLINLPVLKGHCQTTMTCALKNNKGCLPDTEKRHFHAIGLMKPIAALASALKPALTIVDNICGDLNFEEGGNPVETNRIFLGDDMVQLDTFGCDLMGIDTDDVPYIKLAEQYGAGSMSLSTDDIIYLNQDGADITKSKPSGIVSRLVKNVNSKSACSACYGNLVHALYRYSQRYGAYKEDIVIGQDFKDVAFDGVGIGKCCNKSTCKVAGCPPSAMDILKTLEGYN